RFYALTRRYFIVASRIAESLRLGQAASDRLRSGALPRGRSARPIDRSERQADLSWPTLASLNPQAWHVQMRAHGLAPHFMSFPQVWPHRVPLPLLSRLALGKIAELERPRATPKRSALHPTCCLGPLRASRVLAPTHVARKNCLQWLAVQQPSNQGGAYAPV